MSKFFNPIHNNNHNDNRRNRWDVMGGADLLVFNTG